MRQLTRNTGEFRAESRCSPTLVHETGKTKGEKGGDWEAGREEKKSGKSWFRAGEPLRRAVPRNDVTRGTREKSLTTV